MGFPGVVFQEYIPLPGISRSSGHPEYISCIVNIAPLTIVTTYRWKQRYQLIKAKYVEPLVRSFLLSWSFTICLNANPGERLFGILVEWYKKFFFCRTCFGFPLVCLHGRFDESRNLFIHGQTCSQHCTKSWTIDTVKKITLT